MPQLQIAFTKKIDIKNKLTVARLELKKILEDNHQYTKAQEQVTTLRLQMKQMLLAVMQAYPKLADEISALMVEQKLQNELVSDLAVKDYLEEKDITIEDPKNPDLKWEPQLLVKYRRVKKEENN